MPVFTLEAQEGRLFKPLAWTKNLAIAMSAVLAITLIPALLPICIRGKIISEQRHPVSLALQKALCAGAARWPCAFGGPSSCSPLGLSLSIVPAFQRMGSEFMPPLYEGTILYMPTTLPGLSVTEAAQLLQQMDRKLKTFPEVERVFGKAGRAETSTDPAPFSMMEVVVDLKPKEQWRPGLTYEGLVEEMDKALQFPGVTNAWTMPIKARIDMLTTGVRTPVGIKIFGPDLKQIEQIGKPIEMVAKEVPGHPECLCRAGIGRILPGLRHQSRRDRPLRAHGDGRRPDHRIGDRRREHRDDDRGTRALSDQRALSPRTAGRS